MRRKRGNIFIEEALLIAISIAVMVALVTLISGILGNAVGNITNLQHSINGAMNSFIEDIQRVISGAFNFTR